MTLKLKLGLFVIFATNAMARMFWRHSGDSERKNKPLQTDYSLIPKSVKSQLNVVRVNQMLQRIDLYIDELIFMLYTNS